MSYEENLRSLTLLADASIGLYTGAPGLPGSASPNTGTQYRFLKLTGAETVGKCTGATDKVVGIQQNKPQVPGAATTVGYEGVSNVMTGGVVSAGDLLAPDSVGRAVHDDTNGRWLALKPSTGADQLIPAFKIR